MWIIVIAILTVTMTIISVVSWISPVVLGMMIRHVLFAKTIKWVCIVSIVHVVTIVIGIKTVMRWIHTMVVFSVVMAVIWVASFPMGISMVIANIVVLITRKMRLSVSVMVVGWFASHRRYVGRMM